MEGGGGARAAVVARLRGLLGGADDEETTENGLRAELAAEFGAEAVAAASSAIAEEISRFLEGLPPLPEAQAPPEQAAPAPVEARWKRPDPGGAEAEACPKRAKPEPGAGVPPGELKDAGGAAGSGAGVGTECGASLGGSRYVKLETFMGKEMLSIREYYEQGDELKPGKKGITLAPEQWAALKAGAASVSRALKNSEDFELKLSGTRKVSVGTYRGEIRADVREWYSKGAELLPGKKGMSLSQTAWGVLESYLEGVQPAGAGGGTGGGGGVPTGGNAGVSAARGDDELLRVELSATRFLRVRTYRGEPLADIREFYEKDSELKPGLRGTALRREQWDVVHRNTAQISAAIESKNGSFALDLPGTRRVTVSTYRGGLYVDIREWYTDKKSGETRPGKKGISITPEQWEKCVANAGEVDRLMNPPPTAHA